MAKDKQKGSKPGGRVGRGVEKRVRAGAAIQAFIDPDIRAAMDDYMEEFNREAEHKATVTSTLEAALKMYLASKGHWPRKKKPQAS